MNPRAPSTVEAWLSLRPQRALPMAALLACSLAGPAGAATLFVLSGQTNQPPDGLTWSTAFPAVEPALATATAGDCGSGVPSSDRSPPKDFRAAGGKPFEDSRL